MERRTPTISCFFFFVLFLTLISITIAFSNKSSKFSSSNNNNIHNIQNNIAFTSANNKDITITSNMVGNKYAVVPYNEYLPRLEQMLRESISKLDLLTCPDDALYKEWAELIHESMTPPGRVYHSMQHVFDMSVDMQKDPILTLSALFHDVIYYSIDKSFTQRQEKLLQGILHPDTSILSLKSTIECPISLRIIQLFGFELGQPLPKVGTNEFLSAMVGVVALKDAVQFHHLLQISSCIEATIPFRPTDKETGKNPMDRLYDRLDYVCNLEIGENKNEKNEEIYTTEWKVNTVKMSADTANFDLSSFDSDDRDFFLDSSWKLLAEARPALLKDDCPLIEFVNELHAAVGRTMKIPVPMIFQFFRNHPTTEQIEEKRTKTNENLGVMKRYAQVRLLQALVLHEFEKAISDNADKNEIQFPLRPCLLMEMPLEEGSNETKNGTTMKTAPSSFTGVDAEIWSWLHNGRRFSFDWDPARSPLAAYLFDLLGPDGIVEALKVAETEGNLLKYLPSTSIELAAKSLAGVLPDRAEQILAVPEKLGIVTK